MILDFAFFNQWTKHTLGIDLESYKEKQMQRRIKNIMETHGAHSLVEYAQLLEKEPLLRQQFLEHLTINVTEFYRNPELFERFEQQLLLLAEQFPLLKIWSAACSTGAEPYTVAMILKKQKINSARIIATDVDQTILQRAKNGIYKNNELKNISPIEKAACFDALSNDSFQIKKDLKQNVHFKRQDLLKDPYEANVQVILCRNVTIYFKSQARDDVYQKFSDALVPGGILFTGATETINFCEKFNLTKIDSFIYQKNRKEC